MVRPNAVAGRKRTPRQPDGASCTVLEDPRAFALLRPRGIARFVIAVIARPRWSPPATHTASQCDGERTLRCLELQVGGDHGVVGGCAAPRRLGLSASRRTRVCSPRPRLRPRRSSKPDVRTRRGAVRDGGGARRARPMRESALRHTGRARLLRPIRSDHPHRSRAEAKDRLEPAVTSVLQQWQLGPTGHRLPTTRDGCG